MLKILDGQNFLCQNFASCDVMKYNIYSSQALPRVVFKTDVTGV